MMPHSASNRRADVLGVHSLDHFSLTVPDLAQAQKFYTSFGLDVRNARSGFDLHTTGHKHRWGTFREGPQKKLNHLSFGAFADDMRRFANVSNASASRSFPRRRAPTAPDSGFATSTAR